jgi:hypothetical protein
MITLSWLYFLIAVIYLVDCTLWSEDRAIVFQSWFSNRMKLSSGVSLFGKDHPKAFLGNPVIPLGVAFLSCKLPLTLSSRGVGGDEDSDARSNLTFLSFSEMRSIESSGKLILLNGRRIGNCISSGHASAVAGLLERLRESSPKDRCRLIKEEYQRMLDVKEIEQTVIQYRRRSRVLRLMCNLLFCFLFFAIPLMFSLQDSLVGWFWFATILLLILETIVMEFWYAHSALLPEEREERWNAVVRMTLFPPAAIRSNDALSADLLSRFHPVAIAMALTDSATFKNLASEHLRRARFPKGGHALEEDVSQHDAEHREIAGEQIERMLKYKDLDIQSLLEPPVPDSASSLSYCPRCLTQYTISGGSCSECSLPTARFSCGS